MVARTSDDVIVLIELRRMRSQVRISPPRFAILLAYRYVTGMPADSPARPQRVPCGLDHYRWTVFGRQILGFHLFVSFHGLI